MKTSFLYSTAVLLLIGGGAAIAQSPDVSQKREESPRAQTPAAQSPAAHSKEMDRPAAADRMKERAQSEQKGGAKEMQRGEAPTPSERSKQAQEPQGRESKEPTRQSQDQPAQPGRERAPSSTAQQKDGQQGRDAKQSADQKQQAEEKLRSREGQPKQDRAQDTNKPADTKQQNPAADGSRSQGSARPGGPALWRVHAAANVPAGRHSAEPEDRPSSGSIEPPDVLGHGE